MINKVAVALQALNYAEYIISFDFIYLINNTNLEGLQIIINALFMEY